MKKVWKILKYLKNQIIHFKIITDKSEINKFQHCRYKPALFTVKPLVCLNQELNPGPTRPSGSTPGIITLTGLPSGLMITARL